MIKYISTFLVLVIIVVGIWFFTQNNVSNNEILNPGVDDTNLEIGKTPENNNESINNSNNISPDKKMTKAIMHTNKGDITIEFFGTQVPKTVENFIKLAGQGFYDGVKFHRVIKGFMIQSGDPLTKDDSKASLWGTGGPGYAFPDELVPGNRNDVGTISMANAGPNTNGSQFFINVASNNFLDSKHVVFGKVVAGMDVVTKIENTPTDASDRPTTPVIIEGVTLE